ncbi:tetratricopeptide repeat protein [Paraglaciecola aquimarina]|uniref:Tetratricopeptide repeat protein n=1 Tax=Paraglaciecola aquimarina TaxID=1235557 RepID=A0ABU3SSC4_9ALTE|nr:tetratricopeptide repeat protein [Paraglaciecola aquimarina]MDU0352878.1 tetratricopeptide repeat protein [Paraglaciecola aquimarina]
MKTNLVQVLFVASCFFMLAACQSTVEKASIEVPQFYDQGFSHEHQYVVESEEEIFKLDDIAKAYVHNTIEGINEPKEQMSALVHAVFDRSQMNLLYRGDANTLASETFHNQAANCLSLSIMMYSLAKEAGFNVDFQEIAVPETWTRRSGYSLLNGHINLRLSASPSKEENTFYLRNQSYQVDFDPQSSREMLSKRIVSKQNVIAMFYNNKGADALLKNDFNQAYAYFRAALSMKPTFQAAWINLGILYRHLDFFEQAEDAYKFALELDPNSLTTWENLAYLYKFTDREDQANKIFARVERKRRKNPYYYVNLGEEQIERKNWNEALVHFRKALSLDRNRHEIYYGLAQVYFQIGEMQQSERYLKLARNNTNNKQTEQLYQTKLDNLRAL